MAAEKAKREEAEKQSRSANAAAKQAVEELENLKAEASHMEELLIQRAETAEAKRKEAETGLSHLTKFLGEICVKIFSK